MIREVVLRVAGSASTPRIAFFAYDRSIRVWDVETPARIARIALPEVPHDEPPLMVDEEALALSPDGKRCVVSLRHLFAVVCFDVDNEGVELWRRTNVGHVVELRFGEVVYVARDGTKTVALDPKSGADIAGTTRAPANPTRPEKWRRAFATIGEPHALDFCASGTRVVTSEGHVIDAGSGAILRQLDPLG
jgi:hypothetical protein